MMEKTMEQPGNPVLDDDPGEDRKTVNREILKFVLVFLGILCVGYGLYFSNREGSWMDSYLEFVSRLVAWSLDQAGMVTRNKNTIVYNSFAFQIVHDCSGIPSMTILVAAIMAFPATWSRRIIGILIGVLTLFVVNVLRLVCLGMIGDNARRIEAWLKIDNVFTIAHEYVWQGIFIIFVIGFWLIWVEKVVKTKSPAGADTNPDSVPSDP